MPSAPMCSGRSMYFEPSRSAAARTEGPRSTVSEVTIATASTTTVAARPKLA